MIPIHKLKNNQKVFLLLSDNKKLTPCRVKEGVIDISHTPYITEENLCTQIYIPVKWKNDGYGLPFFHFSLFTSKEDAINHWKKGVRERYEMLMNKYK